MALLRSPPARRDDAWVPRRRAANRPCLSTNRRMSALKTCCFVAKQKSNPRERLLAMTFAPSASTCAECSQLTHRNADCDLRRLNRVIANCGRAAFRSKLQDLQDRFGIKTAEINPACTSQECSACGFLASENRDRPAIRKSRRSTTISRGAWISTMRFSAVLTRVFMMPQARAMSVR